MNLVRETVAGPIRAVIEEHERGRATDGEKKRAKSALMNEGVMQV